MNTIYTVYTSWRVLLFSKGVLRRGDFIGPYVGGPFDWGHYVGGPFDWGRYVGGPFVWAIMSGALLSGPF